MNWRLLFGLSILNLVLILVGSLVFYVLEYEKYTPTDITNLTVYTDFLANNPSVSDSDLASFTNTILSAYGNGAVVGNATETDNGWTYDNAIYFSITVLSTIGYGHITPKTTGGKVFCIFYALIGIPLTAAIVAGIGLQLRRPLDRLHQCRPWYQGNENRDKVVKSAVVLTIGTLFMLCVPAAVFTQTEDWDYLTSLYYATITLTTVGFGDYVAGFSASTQRGRGLYRILMSLWLFVGLAFLALVISEIAEVYSRNLHGNASNVGSTTGNDKRDDDKDYEDDDNESRGEEEHETEDNVKSDEKHSRLSA